MTVQFTLLDGIYAFGLAVGVIFALRLGGYDVFEILGWGKKAISRDSVGLRQIEPPVEAPKAIEMDGLRYIVGECKVRNRTADDWLIEAPLTEIVSGIPHPPILIKKGQLGMDEQGPEYLIGSPVTYYKFIKEGKEDFQAKEIAQLRQTIRFMDDAFANLMALMAKMHMSDEMRKKLAESAKSIENRESFRSGWGTSADSPMGAMFSPNQLGGVPKI